MTEQLNFEVKIERYELGYRAVAGTATANFRLPFSESELEKVLWHLTQARYGETDETSPDVQAVRDFGWRLFTTVFSGELELSLRQSMLEAVNKGATLRLRLHLAPLPELQKLLWEYLYFPFLNSFLTLAKEISLVHSTVATPDNHLLPLAVELPLKVLAICPAPSDYTHQDSSANFTRLQTNLKPLITQGLVNLEQLETATFVALKTKLAENSYHILHFVGFSDFEGDNGTLVFEKEAKQAELINAETFAGSLKNAPDLRLVILSNNSEASLDNPLHPFDNVAVHLLNFGIPVIAHRFELTEKASNTFVQAFYGEIATSGNVDIALAVVRENILKSGNPVEWGTPLLYSNLASGKIFKPDVISPAELLQRHIQPIFHDAQTVFAREDWDTAEAKLKEVLQSDPNHIEAQTLLAQVLQEREKTTEYNFALSEYRAGRNDEALAVFRDFELKFPAYKDVPALINEIEAQNALADRDWKVSTLLTEVALATKQADWAHAIAKLEAILQLDPANATAQAQLTTATQQSLAVLQAQAEKQIAQEDWHAALASYKQIQIINPDYPEIAKLIKATETSQREAEIGKQISTLYASAKSATAGEDWEIAITKLKAILEIDPAEEKARTQLPELQKQAEYAEIYRIGSKFYQAGRWEQSLLKFRELFNLVGDYKDIAALIAHAEDKIAENPPPPAPKVNISAPDTGNELDYLNFDLQIEKDPQGWRITVVNAPIGSASLVMRQLFAENDIEKLFWHLSQARYGDMSLQSPDMQAVRDFGWRLFTTVFAGEVEACLRQNLSEAVNQRKGLRVRLLLPDEAELLNLPWEYLFFPLRGNFLALLKEVSLVRSVKNLNLIVPPEPFKVEPPLKMLVVLASPNDYPPVNVEGEWAKLETAMHVLTKRGMLKLEKLNEPTLPALQAQLAAEQYHILHFIGHGDFVKNDGALMFVGQEGQSQSLASEEMASLIGAHPSLRLAVLNDYDGARTAEGDPFASIARTLLAVGVPAVVVLQFEMTDQATELLAHDFYYALAHGYGVDAALQEVRQNLFAKGNDVEWGTPVIYSISPDGRLFQIEAIGIDKQTELQISVYYGEANAALAQEDWDTAIQKLESILDLAPTQLEALDKLLNARKQKEWAELYALAIQEYRQEHWTAALDSFNYLEATAGSYKDTARLINQIKAKIEEQKLQIKLDDLEVEVQTALSREDWYTALEKLEAILLVASDNSQAKAQLAQVKQQQILSELYASAQTLLQAQDRNAARSKLLEITDIAANYKDTDLLLNIVESELAQEQKHREFQKLYQQADEQIAREDWAGAITTLDAILKIDPAQKEAGDKLANVWQSQNWAAQYDTARKYYSAARWQQTIESLKQLQALAGKNYKDTDELLSTATAKLTEEQQSQQNQARLAGLLSGAQIAIEKQDWATAFEKLEAIIAIDSSYQNAPTLREEVKTKLQEIQSAPIETATPTAEKPLDEGLQLAFDLRIEPGAAGYTARAGTASNTFRQPATGVDLENLYYWISQARALNSKMTDQEMLEIKQFGWKLFTGVFGRELEESLRRKLAEAAAQRQHVPLRLFLPDTPQADELWKIPWEFLYLPNFNNFLGVSEEVSILRLPALAEPDPIVPVKADPPLKILVASANPNGFAPVEVLDEWFSLFDASEDSRDKGLITLERLEEGSIEALQNKLWEGKYQILHFVGHVEAEAKSARLLFAGKNGAKQALSGTDLGKIIAEHPSLALVTLRTVEEKRNFPTDPDPCGVVARDLIRAGVPAVVAAQFEMSRPTDAAFLNELYEGLACNLPLDIAVNSARRTVLRAGNDLEWAIPAVYLRRGRGFIFSVSPLSAAKQARIQITLFYKEAGEAIAREDWEVAFEKYREITKLDPTNSDAETKMSYAWQQRELRLLYNAALKSYNAGRLALAFDLFKQVQEINPTYLDTAAQVAQLDQELQAAQQQEYLVELFKTAQQAIEGEDWIKARENLERFLDLTPDYSYEQYGDVDGLMATVMRQSELQELYNKAKAEYTAGNLQTALELLRQLHEREPLYKDVADLIKAGERRIMLTERQGDIEPLFREALIALDWDDWNTAINRLEAILEIDPQNSDAADKLIYVREQKQWSELYNTGLQFYRAGQWGAAVEAFRELRSVAGSYRDMDDLYTEAENRLAIEEQRAVNFANFAPGRPTTTSQPPVQSYQPPQINPNLYAPPSAPIYPQPVAPYPNPSQPPTPAAPNPYASSANPYAPTEQTAVYQPPPASTPPYPPAPSPNGAIVPLQPAQVPEDPKARRERERQLAREKIEAERKAEKDRKNQEKRLAKQSGTPPPGQKDHASLFLIILILVWTILPLSLIVMILLNVFR
jgi:tetratricopeptide (TPR) repeat protein